MSRQSRIRGSQEAHVHLNSLLLFRQYAVPYFTDSARVLELGPDDHPSSYRREVTEQTAWTTADLATESTGLARRRWGRGQVSLVMPSEYQIPSADAAFDIVLSGQVIEHVRRPWLWLPELARVCAQGGVVITLNPVSWPYHEAPVDCWRIFPEGMSALCIDAGLTIELSRSESLEPKPRRWYPGASYDQDSGWRRRWFNRTKATLGWPLPVAFDTITVARKPRL
jgi:SAM-dependent methyltransferase